MDTFSIMYRKVPVQCFGLVLGILRVNVFLKVELLCIKQEFEWFLDQHILRNMCYRMACCIHHTGNY